MPVDASLFRSLAALHRAGVSWPQALESAVGPDARFASARRALEQGSTLAEALRPLVDPLDFALLEAGERDGSLEATLGQIADWHDDAARHRRERGVRLAYPLLLGHVAALLMAVPDLVQGRILAALGWAALVLVPMWTWLRLQNRWERAARDVGSGGQAPQVPALLGPMRNRVEEADARGLAALGRLYDAGVPLADAIELARRAGWGGRVARDLDRAQRRVATGGDLARAFEELPPALARRLEAGEVSGSFGEACRRVAEELFREVDARRRRWAQVLPVVVMLALGLIIALRLFAFYAGYFQRLRGL